MFTKNSHCSYCGTIFPENKVFPVECNNCKQITYQNPPSVAVILVPVEGGLLTIRRGIEPGKGRLALPGGYIEMHESWQEAAARELAEETNLKVSAAEITLFDVISVPGHTLIFSITPDKRKEWLQLHLITEEATELVIIYKEEEMAFPAHGEAVKKFFSKK
jgi:ADP-ribose pyrophosphatase YjhB (NUDIX family)